MKMGFGLIIVELEAKNCGRWPDGGGAFSGPKSLSPSFGV